MKHIFLFIFWGVSLHTFGQELNCKVTINDLLIETADRNIFREMEKEFAQFLNGTKWTEDEYSGEEKINCQIVITPTEVTAVTNFKGKAQIISSRPVYGSSYQTLLINYGDQDWNFSYVNSQPLRFNEVTFTDNITSMLSFYAYLILGVDYDSFSELGGDPYFKKAFEIVNNAQQSGYEGWTQFNSIRNRYWLIENFLSPQFETARKGMYLYHRKGLDIMTENKEEAEENIINVLKEIARVNQIRNRPVISINFLDAKSIELIQLFSNTDLNKKKQSFDLLKKIDPARLTDFQKILE